MFCGCCAAGIHGSSALAFGGGTQMKAQDFEELRRKQGAGQWTLAFNVLGASAKPIAARTLQRCMTVRRTPERGASLEFSKMASLQSLMCFPYQGAFLLFCSTCPSLSLSPSPLLLSFPLFCFRKDEPCSLHGSSFVWVFDIINTLFSIPLFLIFLCSSPQSSRKEHETRQEKNTRCGDKITGERQYMLG